MIRRVALAALVVGAGPGVAWAEAGDRSGAAGKTPEEQYHAGIKAFRAGRLRVALQRFDAVRERVGPDHRLYSPVHYNIGRSVELLAERGSPEHACKGVDAYAVFLERADSKRGGKAVERATAGRERLRETCRGLFEKLPAPAPLPAPEPPSNTPRILAISAAVSLAAGGGLIALAGLADEDADAAYVDYLRATTAAQGDSAADAVRAAESDAQLYSVAGLGALAIAAGLGIAAWVMDDEPAPVAPTAGPGSAGFIWRW